MPPLLRSHSRLLHDLPRWELQMINLHESLSSNDTRYAFGWSLCLLGFVLIALSKLVPSG